MAVPTNTHVHLEAVETARYEETASHQFGYTGVLCTYGVQQPERVLENGQLDNGETSAVKRKTGTLGVL